MAAPGGGFCQAKHFNFYQVTQCNLENNLSHIATKSHTHLHTSLRKMASAQDGHGDLPSEILQILSKQEPLLSAATFPSLKSTEVKAALDRLASRSMVTYETLEREETVLEPEAEGIVANGSHEARVFDILSTQMEGLTLAELEKSMSKEEVKVGQMRAFKAKWIGKGQGGRFVATVYPSIAMKSKSLTCHRPNQLQTQLGNSFAQSKRLVHIRMQQ